MSIQMAEPRIEIAPNLFDEDVTEEYTISLPEPESYSIEILSIPIINDDEQYMVQEFHKQYVAIEGRTAIARLVDTRIGDLAVHSSLVMAHTMLDIEGVEDQVHFARFGRKFIEFDNRIVDQTARHIMETNAIAARSFHEDMRRNPYPPKPEPDPPAPPKRKGLFPMLFEFLFGEI